MSTENPYRPEPRAPRMLEELKRLVAAHDAEHRDLTACVERERKRLRDQEIALEVAAEMQPTFDWIRAVRADLRDLDTTWEWKFAETVEVGVFVAYASTWQPDCGGRAGIPDVVQKGAFAKTLAEHRARGNRPIRMRFNHAELVGAFPVADAREDDFGLRVVGHVNLATQLGRDVWGLIQQGALSDLSIGFKATRDRIDAKRGVRVIEELTLFEISVVAEPCNEGARIIRVEGASAAKGRAVGLDTVAESFRALREDLRAVDGACACEVH